MYRVVCTANNDDVAVKVSGSPSHEHMLPCTALRALGRQIESILHHAAYC